jgi:hypothetical protein
MVSNVIKNPLIPCHSSLSKEVTFCNSKFLLITTNVVLKIRTKMQKERERIKHYITKDSHELRICLSPKGPRPFFGPFLKFGQAIVDAIFVQKISNFR